MDTVNVLLLWQNEGIIVVMMLVGAVLAYYLSKLWSSPVDAAMGMLLGATVALACGVIYLAHLAGFSLHGRIFWFVMLYVWCVLGMMFFAARNTHRIKLFLGLVSQAGILYALFVFL